MLSTERKKHYGRPHVWANMSVLWRWGAHEQRRESFETLKEKHAVSLHWLLLWKHLSAHGGFVLPVMCVLLISHPEEMVERATESGTVAVFCFNLSATWLYWQYSQTRLKNRLGVEATSLRAHQSDKSHDLTVFTSLCWMAVSFSKIFLQCVSTFQGLAGKSS